ncbi:MAG: hypothetical protein ACR2J6_06000 [Thermoleophilaceae bacterium]
MPIPDKEDLKRFCEIDGWEETNARNPDHCRYKKTLDNGDILRTRVSHGRGPVCGDPALWHRIWRHQLELESEDQFWEVLGSGEPAQRGELEPAPEQPGMEAWLFEYLIHRIEIPEDEALAMGGEEAMRLYLEHISPDDPR